MKQYTDLSIRYNVVIEYTVCQKGGVGLNELRLGAAPNYVRLNLDLYYQTFAVGFHGDMSKCF